MSASIQRESAATQVAFDSGYGRRSISYDRTNPYDVEADTVRYDAWERGWESADRELNAARAKATLVNPFIGVNADAMAIVGILLGKAYQSENEDVVMDWIDQWRAARGDAAFDAWRWWIGEVGGESYALDYSTREAAVADAPRAIRAGDFVSADGLYQIVEARGWADDVKAADDTLWFAEQRNEEILRSGVIPGAER